MALVRLQCPACAAIVKITEEIAQKHPVVRCAQCQGMVQVASNRLADTAAEPVARTEKTRPKPLRRKKSAGSGVPIGLILGSILGLLVVAGLGVGLYFLITNFGRSKEERLALNTISMMEKFTGIMEEINSADDVPRVMEKVVKMKGEIEDIKKLAEEVKQNSNNEEMERVKNLHAEKMRTVAEKTMKVMFGLMQKPGVMVAMQKYQNEHGNPFDKIGPSGDLGGLFALPGSGDIGGKGNRTIPNMPPPRVRNSNDSNAGKLARLLTSKKGILENILRNLEQIKDMDSLNFAITAIENVSQELMEINRQVTEETTGVVMLAPPSNLIMKEIVRLMEQMSVQIGRLQRNETLRPEVNRLATALARIEAISDPSRAQVGRNDHEKNPFESAPPGNTSPPQGGGNPFESVPGNPPPRNGNNAAASKSNEPYTPSALDDVLAKLTSSDWTQHSKGFTELQRMKVEEKRRKEVLDALFNLLQERGFHEKKELLVVYRKWCGSQEDKERLGSIADTLLTNSSHIFDDALRFYMENKVVTASAEVARLLKDHFHRKEAANCLVAIGSEAETHVIPYLTDLDNEVRYAAMLVLSRIGTKTSVTELQKHTTDRQLGNAAREAIKLINNRLRNAK